MKFNNIGTKKVYNLVCERLISHNVKANLLSTCKKDLKGCLDYASVVLKTPKAKALFLESNSSKVIQLNKELAISKHPFAKKVQIFCGDSLYPEEFIKQGKVSKYTRIEDYGIRQSFELTLRAIIPQLNRQSKLPIITYRNGKWIRLSKVQILTALIRSKPEYILEMLNQYLTLIGGKIISINGKKRFNKWSDVFSSGKILNHYIDSTLPNTVQHVMEHRVKLAYTDRVPKLYLYTHYNMGQMLTCLLIYK